MYATGKINAKQLVRDVICLYISISSFFILFAILLFFKFIKACTEVKAFFPLKLFSSLLLCITFIQSQAPALFLHRATGDLADEFRLVVLDHRRHLPQVFPHQLIQRHHPVIMPETGVYTALGVGADEALLLLGPGTAALVHPRPTVCTEHQPGEHPHLALPGRPTPLLAENLHPVKGIMVDKGLMGVLENYLLILWDVDALFTLVGFSGALEVDCVPQIFLPGQNAGYRFCFPGYKAHPGGSATCAWPARPQWCPAWGCCPSRSGCRRSAWSLNPASFYPHGCHLSARRYSHSHP